jgi:stage V sporulation protein G
MEITEVRVSLRDNPQTRLKAYATVTFDSCFVVRNVKVIEGRSGLFVAMPSQKPKTSCAKCHAKNDLTNKFCAQCGAPLPRPNFTSPHSEHGERSEHSEHNEHETPEAAAHRDIAHPITMEFRQYLQKKVLEAYEAERANPRSASSASSNSESAPADEAL